MKYFDIAKFGILSLSLFTLFSSTNLNTLFAHPNDLQVINVYRLSHEKYNVVNSVSGLNNPYFVWNRDHTRVLMYESFEEPPGYPSGRGHVWATMSDIKNGLTSLSDYQAKWKKVPGVANRTSIQAVMWSKIVGEENIIYAALTNGYIVKINVDTETAEDLVFVGTEDPGIAEVTNLDTFTPEPGNNYFGCVRGAFFPGWTDNDEIMLIPPWISPHTGKRQSGTTRQYGYFLIDRIAKTSTYYPKNMIVSPPYCDGEEIWDRELEPATVYRNTYYELPVNYLNHGHGVASKSKDYFVKSETGGSNRIVYMKNPGECPELYIRDKDSAEPGGSHYSWNYTDDWFILGTGKHWSTPFEPTLKSYSIHQAHWDPITQTVQYNHLLTQMTAARWDDKISKKVVNYQAHFIPCLSINGKYVCFTSTNGYYSYDDFKETGVEPWQLQGLFMAELGVSGSNNPPEGVINTLSGEVTINVGDSINFTGTYNDPDGDSPQSFSWDFGSGSGIPDSDQEDPGLKQFNNLGTFTVTFMVTDALGLSDPTPATRTIKVTDDSASLADDFSDGNMAGWSVIDEGSSNGPSNWSVQNGRLRQSSNIYGPSVGTTGNRKGTFAYWNDPAALLWADYAFDVTMRSTDNDGIGVMFRYRNQWNYYKYEMDKQRNFHKLFKIVKGVETTLASVSTGYSQGVDMALQVGIYGDQLSVRLDGVDVFGGPISDNDLTAGTIAFYSWGNRDSIYDDVLVSSQGGNGGGGSPPNGEISIPTGNVTINVGDSIDFKGTYSDPDGDSPQSFSWVFGSGSGIPDSDQEDPGAKQFINPGTFIVTFTVTDAQGLLDSTPATRSITVQSTGTDSTLVAHWPFDEGAGLTAYDSSGNGNNGTLVNGPTWETGKVAGALNFDGSDDYVNIGSDNSIDEIFADGGTVAAWIYPRSVGESKGRIFGKRKTNIHLRTTNGITMKLGVTKEYTSSDGTWETRLRVVTANEWNHVVVTYVQSASNDPVIYVNGVKQSVKERTTPSGSTQKDASFDGIIGNNAAAAGSSATTRTFDGLIDDVRFYNRILSESEISGLYDSGN